ncbi:Drug/metabolite transporter [Corchorus olitorius]|uniref:WAT1-related protein n=1 Tax=Corchorus olitorius TaxID=93759 RepID=A0A1R3GMZ9_9ROSI|nr:Drug/metabolite transporter [Corchorus olitorius]
MPHLAMVVSQICYAIVYFITEAAFNHGLNPLVYVTYRYILASIMIFPLAYFLERMEVVDVKNPRGIAKILGTLISLAGVTTITLYKGPALKSLWDAPIHIQKRSATSVHENWVKGPILSVASCITWAMWYIMQAIALKKYPAPLSLTTLINCLGGAQSAVYAVFLHHKPSVWSIKWFSVSFWSIIYSGICSSALVFLQFWCMKEKGPVFAAMFNPLQTVIVVVLAYFVLGEKLFTGSILGGVVVIIGLYLLLWGKERDLSYIKREEQSASDPDELNASKTEEVASAEKEEP